MEVLIDARSKNALLRIYSLSLVERLIRQLNEVSPERILIWINPDQKAADFLNPETVKRTKVAIKWLQDQSAVESVLQNVAQKVAILDGHGLYDERVIDKLLNSETPIQIIDRDSNDYPAAICLHQKELSEIRSGGAFLQVKELLPKIHVQDMQTYIRFLRRDVVPTLMRIDEKSNLRAIENFLYENTFKGGMEFVAVYGYRYPVRALTRWTAKTPITPNMITFVATICKVAAVPFFFMGWIGWGLFSVASFIILDSLDGKLARMTIRFSDLFDKVDHLTSLPARIGWNLGLTWHFSQGEWFSLPGIAGLIATIVPFLDDINWTIIKLKFHRSLFDFTRLDSTVHLFTVKRNDTALLIIGFLIGKPLEAFYGVAFWTLLTWFWRCYRTAYILFVLQKRHPELVK